ncbi:E3 ubiquitin-protein ligase AIRP2-like isoform X2 [Wolffia australiana]
MRVGFTPLATVYLFLLDWLDCACSYSLLSYLGLLHVLVAKVYIDGKTKVSSYERQATLQEFYGTLYPSLQQLESNSSPDSDEPNDWDQKPWRRAPTTDKELERENECGICMEHCTKMVLPTCNHAMCINCYHDWNMRSQSCPFCRGSLRRVSSRDLWVLTGDGDVLDAEIVVEDDLRRLHWYINSLPLSIPDTLFFVYYDFLL